MFSFFKAYRDRPVAWGMYQQDPATSVMEGIRDLNRDIHFFLIVILVQVQWLIFRIVYRFHHKSMPVPERFNHHTALELVWAILPSVIVTAIALPSLSQIFTYDDLVAKPMLTVKVIGRQWYWQYALRESVDFSLRKQRDLLLTESNSILITYIYLFFRLFIFLVAFIFFLIGNNVYFSFQGVFISKDTVK